MFKRMQVLNAKMNRKIIHYVSLLSILAVFLININGDDYLTFPTNIEKIKHRLKTERPTIGILSMFVAGKQIMEAIPEAKGSSYIASSFVSFVEGMGARAVPIPENLSNKEVDKILKSINGAILPGGDVEIIDVGYDRIAQRILDYSINQKKKGINWPIYAINRGAQRLAVFISKKDVIAPFDTMNLSMPLELTAEANKSRLLKYAAVGIRRTLAEQPVAFNVHKTGIDHLIFTNNTEAMKFYRIISTNTDRNGSIFISTFEARHYPIYAFQWQPEKILYVWNPLLAVDHSPDALRVSQYLANFFAVEARKNSHHFPSRALEEARLIYPYPSYYIGNLTASPYEKIYLFRNANATTFDNELTQHYK